MNEKIVTVSADERLDTVDDIMGLGHVRHLPVVTGGELVGIISERDLLRASLSSISNVGLGEKRAFLNSIKLREIMSASVVTITPDTTVQEAAEIMADEKIGCLPVVEDSRLVGMVTETDLLHFMANLGRAGKSASKKKKKGAA